MRATDYVRPGETIDDVIIRYFKEHDATAAYLYLEGKVLTEENTDQALEWMRAKLGRIKLGPIPLPMGIIVRVLDAMLPEKVLALIKDLMVRKGLVSERKLAEGNPFLK